MDGSYLLNTRLQDSSLQKGSLESSLAEGLHDNLQHSGSSVPRYIAFDVQPSPRLDFLHHRGDLVSIETWFQPEGRLGACRNWIIRDAATQKIIGRGTR